MTTLAKDFEKIAFVASDAPEARAALLRLVERYGNVAVDEAELHREQDPAEIDRLWAEAPAFGPGLAGCGAAAKPTSNASVVRFYKGMAR